MLGCTFIIIILNIIAEKYDKSIKEVQEKKE
jgi:hypothetical protein